MTTETYPSRTSATQPIRVRNDAAAPPIPARPGTSRAGIRRNAVRRKRQNIILLLTASGLGLWFGLAAPGTSPVAPPPTSASTTAAVPTAAAPALQAPTVQAPTVQAPTVQNGRGQGPGRGRR